MSIQMDLPILIKQVAQTNSYIDHKLATSIYSAVAIIILIALGITLFLWAENIQSVLMSGAIMGILIILIYVFHPSIQERPLHQENYPVQQEDVPKQDRPSINRLEPDAQM